MTHEQAVQIIWEYMRMHHTLEKADCILALGSHDTRVAKRAADLYKSGYSQCIIFSGGVGRLTADWQITEADSFAKIAIQQGVPSEHILIENKSTNLGENIRFTYKFLEEKGIHPEKVILVQKPYMERRAYAAFKKQWPDPNVKLMSTAPLLSFKEYITDEISEADIINIMIGDLQRIREYPAKGFQIKQDIPSHAWEAYEFLVKEGYTEQLVKE